MATPPNNLPPVGASAAQAQPQLDPLMRDVQALDPNQQPGGPNVGPSSDPNWHQPGANVVNVNDPNRQNGQFYGEEINAQLQQRDLQHQQQLQQMQGQFSEQLGSIKQQNEMLTQQLQNIAANTPQQRQVDPYEKYALTEEERVAADGLLDPIDKRVAAGAEKTAHALRSEFQQMLDQERQQFSTALKNMESQLHVQKQAVEQSFDTQLHNMATQYGLDLTSLKTDDGWNKLLQEPNSITDPTPRYEIVRAALEQRDTRPINALMAHYANGRQVDRGLAGIPGTGPARDQGALGGNQQDDPLVELTNQREQIIGKLRELQVKSDAREISQEQFQQAVGTLTQYDADIMLKIDALQKNAAAT